MMRSARSSAAYLATSYSHKRSQPIPTHNGILTGGTTIESLAHGSSLFYVHVHRHQRLVLLPVHAALPAMARHSLDESVACLDR